MPNRNHSRIVILGSGPAGYTAAIYAARANLDPILIKGLQPGGQLTITTDVENYPGYADAVQGPWLMEQMERQAARVGTRMFEDSIVAADVGKRPFIMSGDSGEIYAGDTIVICTGASARWLEIPSEEKFKGFGVSACATCDGFFFRGERVAVVGGGNTAAEEAIFLTNFATKVTVIHRREELRAEKILQDRMFRNPKIEMAWSSVVDEILGTDDPPGVAGVRIRNVKTGAARVVDVTGVFIAIGHTPNTELFRGQLQMDAEGYVVTAPDSTATSIAGVYAAGDVQDRIYRQAVTAAGTGCMAALEAEKFLAEQETVTEAAQ